MRHLIFASSNTPVACRFQCGVSNGASLSVDVRQQHDCNIMKRLFSSPVSAAIGLVQSRLEAAGIECETRNEHLSPAMPGTPFDPELWVLSDSQFAEASELLAAWRQRASPPVPATP